MIKGDEIKRYPYKLFYWTVSAARLIKYDKDLVWRWHPTHGLQSAKAGTRLWQREDRIFRWDIWVPVAIRRKPFDGWRNHELSHKDNTQERQ